MTKKQQIEEIKAVQAKIADTVNGINALNAKLAEIEGDQFAAHVAERNIPKLTEQLQNIQADIAIGTGKQSDLDQVSREIEKAKADVEYHEHTVTGLKSKLSNANTELSNLQDTAIYAVRAFIENEAEALHSLYMEQAGGLLATFRSLKALSAISKGVGGNPFATGDECNFITIPVFQFVSSGQWPNNFSGRGCRWLPADDMARPELYAQEDEDAERAKLVKMGIQI